MLTCIIISASVNTSYEVDLFGHIRSLKAQVLEQYLATQEASRSAQITLVAEVAVQYLTERALDEQLELLQQTLKSVESYYDLINKSYQLGNSSALDLRSGPNPGADQPRLLWLIMSVNVPRPRMPWLF